MNGDQKIVVTLGPCDDMRAEVFVRPLGDLPAGTRLAGSVTGPQRGCDVTLPTTARLVPLPEVDDSGTLSRAILTEPAFWTPELPNLYRVDARLEPDGSHVVDARIGLRRLGVRGRSFWLDGRRWVPRAVGGATDLAGAREAAVALLVESPGGELLERTDMTGVAVVAVLHAAETTPARIAALARHASAVLAVVPNEAVDAESIAALRRAKGTLQIGVVVDGRAEPPMIRDGIDFVVLRLGADGVPYDGWRSPSTTPMVAWRRDSVGSRSACDSLQRDLARWGLAAGNDRPAWDWAGYLVGAEIPKESLPR